MKKIYNSAEDAIFDVQDGAVIALGGFGLCGIPENGIAALVAGRTGDHTFISNNAGTDDFGLGLLIANSQAKKLVVAFIGENQLCQRLHERGELDIEFSPQGTLVERLRAGGAGIPAFYTPTGAGTFVAHGKESSEFDGRNCILETCLTPDFAFVKAWRGDAAGNLQYRKSARNNNPVVATAARVTIAEVEELVDIGTIEPDQVHTPGIFVQRLFQGRDYEKRIFNAPKAKSSSGKQPWG